MESANLHQQHQLQEQFDGSSLATPSLYGVASNNNSWNPNLILNAGNFNLNINGVYSNSRDFKQNSDHLAPPLNTSMIQDSGFHWTSSTGSFTNQSAHELHLANKIKEELSDSNSSKFSDEEFHLPSTSYTKREQHDLHDLSEKLFLKTFSSGCQLNGPQVSIGEMYSKPLSSASFGGAPTSSKGYFSQISPSTYISNLNPSSPSFLNSLGMNFQALDLLNSTKFGGSFAQPAHNNNLGLFKESLSFGLEHMQESSTWPPNSPNKISSFMNGATETKRSSSFSEPKASHTATKKPRMETRSSLAPFKVRKEKLGDRIAALQQLVAPFGKTDTASVLMEAIGYIKFLQDQVETLNVPYMKASRNNTRRSIQEGSSEGEREEEPKRDLRSRGLCLVPLSCTSYIANDSLGVWPPTNFGGRT